MTRLARATIAAFAVFVLFAIAITCPPIIFTSGGTTIGLRDSLFFVGVADSPFTTDGKVWSYSTATTTGKIRPPAPSPWTPSVATIPPTIQPSGVGPSLTVYYVPAYWTALFGLFTVYFILNRFYRRRTLRAARLPSLRAIDRIRPTR